MAVVVPFQRGPGRSRLLLLREERIRRRTMRSLGLERFLRLAHTKRVMVVTSPGTDDETGTPRREYDRAVSSPPLGRSPWLRLRTKRSS